MQFLYPLSFNFIISNFKRFLFGVFLCVFVLSGTSLSVIAASSKDEKKGEGTYEYNETERLVFGLSHMDNVQFGQTLKYKFERQGVFGDDFKDSIELLVSKGKGEANKSVAFKFFSGARNRPYPDFGFVSANPLITLYFNKDAWDLARKIKAKGTANYLRNRIIDGLSKVKVIDKTVCTYQGRDYPAQVIRFEPYKGDENGHHLVHYALISYELTIAKDLPGGLCRIKSVVPQHVGGVPDYFRDKIRKAGMVQLAKEADLVTSLKEVKKPLIVEVLSFDSVRQTGVAQTK